MRTAANPNLVRYNRAVILLPHEQREPYLERTGTETYRIIQPDNPIVAFQELVRQTGLNIGSLLRESEPTAHMFRQPTNTIEDFWHMQGWVKTDQYGNTTLTVGHWKDDPAVQIDAIRFLVERVLAKDPRDVTTEDFASNRLSGLLSLYYRDSVYDAVAAAYPQFDIKPWEMSMTPNGFYSSAKNRAAATRWLVEWIGKDPRDLTQEDFESNRLSGLLFYHSGSPYAAVVEAYPKLNIKPWEMLFTPNGFYATVEHRAAATRWLVNKLGKDPKDMTAEDFCTNRLSGLLENYYRDSPYAAVAEAYPELDIKPWEMAKAPNGSYLSAKNRDAARTWLAEKLGKNPRDLTKKDFYSNGLSGLISHAYRD